MKFGPSQIFVRDLDILYQVGTVSGLTDRELLGHLTTRESEAAQRAFEAIIHRHGPMVLGVCRRVLGDEHAAEDAFQATFLVLAIKAGAIRKLDSLGPWLHGVAARVSRRARALSRRRVERPPVPGSWASCPPEGSEIEAAELRALLDEEIQRLPPKYRLAVVLCYLEGKSQEAAARELGWTKGTVSSRLARAKELLRTRLTRRGLAPSVGVVGMLLTPENASAAVPVSMTGAARRIAFNATLCRAEMIAATSPAVVLAKGAIRAMLLGKAKVVCAALLVLVALASAVARTAIGPEPHGPGRFESRWAALRLQPVRLAETTKPAPPEPRLPDRARARLGTMHLRHDGQVHEVVFSPDGRTVASTSFNEVCFWDSTIGALAPGRPTLKESANVMALAYSPDGGTIAIGHEDGVIRLWDLVASRERLRIRGHRGWVIDIAFAPDGRSFATVTSGDSHIRVWDVANGRERRALEIDSPVFRNAMIAWGTLAFAPDGRRLAVSAWPVPGQAEMIGICDLVGNGKPVIIPNAHKVGVHSLVFTPDGHTLLSCGSDTRRIKGHDQAVFMVEFLPQLEFVPKVRLWDADTGRLLRELDPGDVTGECAIASSRDGRTLVSNHRDRLLVWDLASGRIVRSIPAETNNLPLSVRSLALGPDGRTLAVLRGDHMVHFWDIATGKPLFRRDEVHESAVLSVAIAQDGRLLVTGDDKGTIHLWDAGGGAHVRRIDLGEQGEIRAVAFSSDGQTLGAAADYFDYKTPPFRFRGLAGIWNVSDGSPRGKFQLDTAATHLSRAIQIAFSPNGQRVAIALASQPIHPDLVARGGLNSEFVIQVHEAATGRRQTELRGHQGWIQAIGFAPDGKWLVSAGADMTFRFWDLAAGRMIRQFPITGHFRSDIGAAGKPTRIRAAVFSADLTRAITSGELDDRLIIWDLSPDRLRRRTIRVTGNRGATLAVSQDGRIFASASAVHLDPEGDDTSIRVWSGADGRELLRLETGGRRVRSLAFSAGGRSLISGMDDTTAVIWDISAADDVLKRPRD